MIKPTVISALYLSLCFHCLMAQEQGLPHPKTQKVLGRFLKLNKDLKIGLRYFILLQKNDGKNYAFPFKSKKINPALLYNQKFYQFEIFPSYEELNFLADSKDKEKPKVPTLNVMKASFKPLRKESDLKNPFKNFNLSENDQILKELKFISQSKKLYELLETSKVLP